MIVTQENQRLYLGSWEYNAGKEFASGRKYRYTLQYNPLALMHTWITRQAKSGGAWEWVQPLAHNMQFTPRGSARETA